MRHKVQSAKLRSDLRKAWDIAMRVFITGGSGQVGSHIAETLLGRGDEVLPSTTSRPVAAITSLRNQISGWWRTQLSMAPSSMSWWRSFDPMRWCIRQRRTRIQTIGRQMPGQLHRNSHLG